MNTCTTEIKGDLFILHLPDVWKKETNNLFTLETPGLIEQITQSTLVIDFTKVVIFDVSSISGLLSVIRTLQKSNKNVICTNAGLFIQKKILATHMRKYFEFATISPSPDKSSAPQKPKAKIDVRIINPFIEAALSTLQIQCNVEITSKPPFLKNANNQLPVEIAGVISLICDQFKGSTSLCFTNQVFLNIYEAMVGERHSDVTGEIQDAASELLNIIYGTAKTTLNTQLQTNLKPALPTLLTGEKIRIHQKTDAPVIVVPFDSSAGPFHIEICTDD